MEVSLKRIEVQLDEIEEFLKKQAQASPSEQVKAISLRSGKNLQEVHPTLIPSNVSDDVVSESVPKERVEEIPKESQPTPSSRIYYPPVPFPAALKRNKTESQFSELYNLLSKVNINLPLLNVVTSIPSYTKFFKELSTRKRQFIPNEKVVVSEQASAVLRKDLPPKLKDPGSFNIMISIGGSKQVKAMLDLGASINLMPYSLFCELKLEGLKPTTMSLQLADRSVKYPKGIVEDVLVQIDKLIIPVDFVVLDMDRDDHEVSNVPILLGRPFMATADAMINVKSGTLSLQAMGKTVNFNLFDPMKRPYEVNEVYCCEVRPGRGKRGPSIPNNHVKKNQREKDFQKVDNHLEKVGTKEIYSKSLHGNKSYLENNSFGLKFCESLLVHEDKSCGTNMSTLSVVGLTNVQRKEEVKALKEFESPQAHHKVPNEKENKENSSEQVKELRSKPRKKKMVNSICHGAIKAKSLLISLQLKSKGKRFKPYVKERVRTQFELPWQCMES